MQSNFKGLPKREKLFGYGRPRALDRNAKVRIMFRARALSRRTEKGKHYGVVTAKALLVLEALLWGFHNARSGLCYPSYEKIAERAGCARSTVYDAISRLESAGVLAWVNRVARIKERCVDLLGPDVWRVRVIRTSNAYHFFDPCPPARAVSSKSDLLSETQNQEFTLPIDPDPALERSLSRLKRAVESGAPPRR